MKYKVGDKLKESILNGGVIKGDVVISRIHECKKYYDIELIDTITRDHGVVRIYK